MNLNNDQNSEENINIPKIISEEIKIEDQSLENEDKYKFGWSNYSEITNGRFAMLGFLAIILIELLSKQAFLQWAGVS